jgi:hypothetical protein
MTNDMNTGSGLPSSSGGLTAVGERNNWLLPLAPGNKGIWKRAAFSDAEKAPGSTTVGL